MMVLCMEYLHIGSTILLQRECIGSSVLVQKWVDHLVCIKKYVYLCSEYQNETLKLMRTDLIYLAYRETVLLRSSDRWERGLSLVCAWRISFSW